MTLAQSWLQARCTVLASRLIDDVRDYLELDVKQRFFLGLVCTTLLVVGCSSQPARIDSIGGTSGPEILLPNGKVEQAQLLAMGMARSKGWTIVASDDRRLLLERQLPENAPQARVLSPEGVLSAPKLQVETQLRERGNDVIASLSSSIIVNPGTEQERRIDYTNDYQDQLMISLNALASAWLENRTRIASEIPLPPDPDEVVIAEAGRSIASDTSGATSISGSSGATDEPAEPSTDISTIATIAAPTSAQAAPVEPRRSSSETAPQVPQANASASPGQAVQIGQTDGQVDQTGQSPPATQGPIENNEMLVLDGQARRGLWTFYAEASARERGCAVGERGAVLLSATTAFELYEVSCTSSPNLLLRCQGGVCREIN